MKNPDIDLESKSRDELITEAKTLREAIRRHRDCSGHELCWYHPEMWSLLPEASGKQPVVPDWPEFMEGCLQYRKSLDTASPNAQSTKKG